MNSARSIKDEASAPGTGAAIIASKSTATQAQYERILTMLARKGFDLHPTATGIYIVTRWNLARSLTTLPVPAESSPP